MSGRIKAGVATLIGNAGEYYVMAELLKRGVVAALAPRNAPGFDILATKGDKTVRIRVKTKSGGYDEWQWKTKADGSLFRQLCKTGDFTVLVHLAQETQNLRFYVVRTAQLDEWLRGDFDKWLATPGRGGRPHSPSNRKRNLSYKEYADRLGSDWDMLWTES